MSAKESLSGKPHLGPCRHHFLPTFTLDVWGTDEDQYYEEAVESEEETSDGGYSVVTDQHADVPSPEDESADM